MLPVLRGVYGLVVLRKEVIISLERVNYLGIGYLFTHNRVAT